MKFLCSRSACVAGFVAALWLAVPAALAAQPTTPGSYAEAAIRALSPEALANIVANARPDAPATLKLANREVVVFRAAILGRSAQGRADAASELLQRFIAERADSSVTVRPLAGGLIVSVGARDVFALVPVDVDPLLGETLESKGTLAAANLQRALEESIEGRRPRRLAWAVLQSLLATAGLLAIVWLLGRIQIRIRDSLSRRLVRKLAGSVVADEIVRRTRLSYYAHHVMTGVSVVFGAIVFYLWLTFVLRRFPYTRPWGESLRELLLSRLAWCLTGIVDALPALVTLAVIVVVTRLVIQMLKLVFSAVEQERISLPGMYPETAGTTGKLVAALMWLFALAVSYPYLPGSETEAFKGVSVFVGLMVSLGSSGLVNQVMSGFTVTYSRALRRGDFVQVGDITGTVTHIGTLSTKIETPRREEVTIPNAVLVSQTVTNFSRHADTRGVYTPTAVTIGYDAPWRQVQALLLLAASRTEGVRAEPPPTVFQTGLEDFYVRYTLLVALDDPRQRGPILNRLHANVQDAFNEAGVQIMSPNYEADPEGPKIVPRDRWFAQPDGPKS